MSLTVDFNDFHDMFDSKHQSNTLPPAGLSKNSLKQSSTLGINTFHFLYSLHKKSPPYFKVCRHLKAFGMTQQSQDMLGFHQQ